MPTFATVVGVAPSTTTMTLGAAAYAKPVERPDAMSMIRLRADAIVSATPTPSTSSAARAKKKLQPPPPQPQRLRYYMPYASLEDLRSAVGLGIVNESDAWLTGRPYGLPGTATLRLDQRPGGYHSPAGHHYDASMVGGGFGDADTVALTLQVAQIVEAQKAQQASLKRIAFWQTMTGGLVVGSIAISAVIGVVGAVRQSRGSKRHGRGGR